MQLNILYGPTEFGGLPATPPADKPFDVHHNKDKIWLALINETEVYWDILREDGTLVMRIGRYMQNCVYMDPRPRLVVVHANGVGAAITTVIRRVWTGYTADMPFVPAALNF